MPPGRRMLPYRSTSRKGASTVTAPTLRGRRSGQLPVSCWSTRSSTTPRPASPLDAPGVPCARGGKNHAPVSARRGPTFVGTTPGWRTVVDLGLDTAGWVGWLQRRPSKAVNTSARSSQGPASASDVRRSSTRRRDTARSANSPRVDSPDRPVAPWSRACASARSIFGWRRGRPMTPMAESTAAQNAGQGEPHHVARVPPRSGLQDRGGPQSPGEQEREAEIHLAETVVITAPQEGQDRRSVAGGAGVQASESHDADERGQQGPPGRERPRGEGEGDGHRNEQGRRHHGHERGLEDEHSERAAEPGHSGDGEHRDAQHAWQGAREPGRNRRPVRKRHGQGNCGQ